MLIGHHSEENHSMLQLRDHSFILTLAQLGLDDYDSFCAKLWGKFQKPLENIYNELFTYRIYLARNENIGFFRRPVKSIILVGQGIERIAFIIPPSITIYNYHDLESCPRFSITLTDNIKRRLERFFPEFELIKTASLDKSADIYALQTSPLNISTEIQAFQTVSLNTSTNEAKATAYDEVITADKVADEIILVRINKKQLKRDLIRTTLLAMEEAERQQTNSYSLINIEENKTLALIYTFLPDEEKEQFSSLLENLVIAFRKKIIALYELENFPSITAILQKRLERFFGNIFRSTLQQQLLQQILTVPSLREIYDKNPKTQEAICISNLKQISARVTLISDENAYTFSSRTQNDLIEYFGFAKIHSCIGVVLRHHNGNMFVVHVSAEVDIPTCIATIVDHFEADLVGSDNLLDIRLVGGATEEEQEIHNLSSDEALSKFFYQLLLSLLEKKTRLIIWSADIFTKTNAFRAYNEKLSLAKDTTIGWLINRNGQIPLFKYPRIGYVPFTNRSCSVLLDDLKNSTFWRQIRKACNEHPGQYFNMHEQVSAEPNTDFLTQFNNSTLNTSAIIKIYDDVTQDWNHYFILYLNRKFKEILIDKIIIRLTSQNLAYSAEDRFTSQLINKHIETWASVWYQLLQDTLDNDFKIIVKSYPFFYHFRQFTHHAIFENEHYRKFFTMPLSRVEINYLFFNLLCADGCMKAVIHHSMYLRCADLLINSQREKAEKQVGIRQQSTQEEKKEAEKASEPTRVQDNSIQKKDKEKETEGGKETAGERTSIDIFNLEDLAEHPIVEILTQLKVSPWHLFDEINTYLIKTQMPSPEMTALSTANNLIVALLENPESAFKIISAWQDEILVSEIDRIVDEYLQGIGEELINSIKATFRAYDVDLLHFLHNHSTVNPTLESLMESLRSLIPSHKWAVLDVDHEIPDLERQINGLISNWQNDAQLVWQDEPFTNVRKEAIIALMNESPSNKEEGSRSCCVMS
jgi:hypothetical protein